VLAQLRTGVARHNSYFYQINVAETDQLHVDKQERPRNTSSFDVGSGPHTGRKCGNVPILTDATYTFAWAENRLRMTRTGRRTWKSCESQYDSQSPRADSTPLNLADQHNDTLPLTNLHLPPCAKDGRRASTAEDMMLNTWRSAFKPVYQQNHQPTRISMMLAARGHIPQRSMYGLEEDTAYVY
jgi:hypothetical protein